LHFNGRNLRYPAGSRHTPGRAMWRHGAARHCSHAGRLGRTGEGSFTTGTGTRAMTSGTSRRGTTTAPARHYQNDCKTALPPRHQQLGQCLTDRWPGPHADPELETIFGVEGKRAREIKPSTKRRTTPCHYLLLARTATPSSLEMPWYITTRLETWNSSAHPPSGRGRGSGVR
jgi:hypothetical protein